MRKLWAVILRETSDRRQLLVLALILGVLSPAVSYLPPQDQRSDDRYVRWMSAERVLWLDTAGQVLHIVGGDRPKEPPILLPAPEPVLRKPPPGGRARVDGHPDAALVPVFTPPWEAEP